MPRYALPHSALSPVCSSTDWWASCRCCHNNGNGVCCCPRQWLAAASAFQGCSLMRTSTLTLSQVMIAAGLSSFCCFCPSIIAGAPYQSRLLLLLLLLPGSADCLWFSVYPDLPLSAYAHVPHCHDATQMQLLLSTFQLLPCVWVFKPPPPAPLLISPPKQRRPQVSRPMVSALVCQQLHDHLSNVEHRFGWNALQQVGEPGTRLLASSDAMGWGVLLTATFSLSVCSYTTAALTQVRVEKTICPVSGRYVRGLQWYGVSEGAEHSAPTSPA